jgi:hypothetical protein
MTNDGLEILSSENAYLDYISPLCDITVRHGIWNNTNCKQTYILKQCEGKYMSKNLV